MTQTADIEVICPGMLEVLSVGHGDLKLSFDPGNEDDTQKAKAIIEEMLRKGYSIFVETDVGPARVQRFSAERMAYIITELAPGNELPSGPAPSPALESGPVLDAEVVNEPTVAKQTGVGPPEDASVPPRRKPGRSKKTVEKDVPVAGSKATAVGRTAGG
jgi:hypothetical protein